MLILSDTALSATGRYLKGWFVLDVLGCLPIDYILLIIALGKLVGLSPSEIFRVLLTVCAEQVPSLM
jgi:hypothetical protein